MTRRFSAVTEVDRLLAFARRDFKIRWSYRTAFIGDILNLFAQVVMFAFIGLMIDPAVLPEYGGQEPSYLGFAAIGIALGAFIQLGMGRVSTAIRTEQLMGTLEPLFMTPTRSTSLQVGMAIYDFIYVPLRTALLLAAMVAFLDVGVLASGILPTMLLIVFFVPFVWGLGTLAAAAILTFKRGGAGLGLAALLLNITSGAYFPLDLLPDWMQTIANLNPIAVAMEASREALLGGEGWGAVVPHLAFLFVAAMITLVLGWAAVRMALRREHRLGTLGAY